MYRIRWAVAILLGLFALLTLLDRFVLVELLVRRIGASVFIAAIVTAGILAAGTLARRKRDLDPPVDFLIGYPIFGTLCFLIGLLHIGTATMLGLIIALCVAAAALRRRFSRMAHAPAAEAAAATLVVVVLLCGFIVAQAPPISLDELAYHLAVPHTWAMEGRAVNLPLLSHSYFPLGIESADLPLFAMLDNADAAIASHLLHLLAAIAMVMVVLRRTRSWLTTAAIATTPALAITAGWSLVDWPLAGLFVVLATADDEDDAVAATAAGLLTKYTFLPFAIAAWVLRRRWKPALIAFACGSVFFLRNLILTGNPIAPFFLPGAPHVSGYRELSLASYVFADRFIDESLGATLLSLVPFAAGLLPAIAAVLGLALFFLGPSSRIVVPYLVVPAVSAAPVVRRRFMTLLVATAAAIQLLLVVWFTDRNGAFQLISGFQTDQQYVASHKGNYAAIAWLNASLPRDSRTLVVGLNETFWFERRVRGGGNFDGGRMSHYLELPTPEALRDRLRRDGITHVAVLDFPQPTTGKKLEERETRLSPAAQRVLVQTLNHYASNVTSRGPATLFTLR